MGHFISLDGRKLDDTGRRVVGRISSRSPSPSGTVPIFEVDPDLLAGVSRHVTREIAETRVPCLAVKTGPWTPPAAAEAFAFMVMSGAVARETRVPGERSLELLGPGDVVLSPADDILGSVPSVALWEALQPSELALLDERFASQTARAPRILIRLARRAADRADRNLIQMTIAGAHPLRRRVELLLWHLADRWGVRKEGGINLPIRLTQRTLAALAATERSTVCRVLIELVDDGTLERLPEKHLRLMGPPPSQELIELAEERLSLERGVRADLDP